MPIIGGIYTASGFVYIVVDKSTVYRISIYKIYHDSSKHIELSNANIVEYLTDTLKDIKKENFFKYVSPNVSIFKDGYVGKVPKQLLDSIHAVHSYFQGKMRDQ